MWITTAMKRYLPKKIVVLVDSREKYPILFPRYLQTHWGGRLELGTRSTRCDVGDYCLEMAPRLAVVERKGSVQELYANLIGLDRTRATLAFDRLCSLAQWPYLLLDFPVSEFVTSRPHCEQPWRVADALYDMVVRRGLRLWWSPHCRTSRQRVSLGEQLVRLMLSHWKRAGCESEKKLPDPLDPATVCGILSDGRIVRPPLLQADKQETPNAELPPSDRPGADLLEPSGPQPERV